MVDNARFGITGAVIGGALVAMYSFLKSEEGEIADMKI